MSGAHATADVTPPPAVRKVPAPAPRGGVMRRCEEAVALAGGAMGALLSSAFIPPDSLLGCSESEDGDVTCLDPFESADWYWGLVQALSLLGVYGYILFQASNMLSEGSELLLLVPQVAGLVGSVVLPILGAVPDGAIMLFSGLGEGAQKNLQVGVGALAGSTIMLLTVPWGLCTLVGSVPLDAQGRPNYAKRAKKSLSITTLSRHGIKPEATIRKNAYVMMATAVGYLVIQFPAWSYAMRPSTSEVESALAGEERWWAFGALIFSTLAFIVYLALMFHQSEGSAELQARAQLPRAAWPATLARRASPGRLPLAHPPPHTTGQDPPRDHQGDDGLGPRLALGPLRADHRGRAGLVEERRFAHVTARQPARRG